MGTTAGSFLTHNTTVITMVSAVAFILFAVLSMESNVQQLNAMAAAMLDCNGSTIA